MHFVYVDDSKDERLAIFSALFVPADQWKSSFSLLKNFRKELNDRDGILLRKELHATDLVSGRGCLGPNIVPKGRRCQIFKDAIAVVASLPGMSVINVCMARGSEDRAFEYLLNRIQMAMKKAGSHALVISDRGKEGEYTRLARRMGIYNPIPSQHGTWEDGAASKNIPIDNILEDLVFKDSKSSYFVQMADLCAYALLRREHPIESKSKYRIQEAFEALSGVLNRNACGKDPEGIVRY